MKDTTALLGSDEHSWLRIMVNCILCLRLLYFLVPLLWTVRSVTFVWAAVVRSVLSEAAAP